MNEPKYYYWVNPGTGAGIYNGERFEVYRGERDEEGRKDRNTEITLACGFWEDIVSEAGITEEEYEENPERGLDALDKFLEELLGFLPEYEVG